MCAFDHLIVIWVHDRGSFPLSESHPTT